MLRLTLTKALTLREGEFFFRRGHPVEVSETQYHLLCLTGRLADPDRSFESMIPASIKRLAPGTIVTVVRSMGLGDILMVLPVIRALKREYPHLLFRYCVGTAYAPLLAGIDFLHDTTPIIEMQGKVPNVLELRGLSERHEKRKVMDRIDIFALYCGVRVEDYTIGIPVSAKDRAEGIGLIGGPGPTIALTYRGSAEHRSWIPSHVRGFAKMAADEGWRVVILDNQVQEFPEHERIVNLSGQLNLLQVKSVLAVSDFCVAPDTGLVHLSEAVGTKCLALFGSYPPELRVYHYKNVKSLWRRELPCSPCWSKGCAALPCMSQLTPEIVMDSINGWESLGRDTDPKPFALVPASAA